MQNPHVITYAIQRGIVGHFILDFGRAFLREQVRTNDPEQPVAQRCMHMITDECPHQGVLYPDAEEAEGGALFNGCHVIGLKTDFGMVGYN